MPKPLLEKLGVTGNVTSLVLSFVTRRAHLERQFPFLAQSAYPAGALWIAWPKSTSGVATDLSENVVRDIGLMCGLVDVKVAAIDDVWSGLKFVYRLVDRRGPAGRSARRAERRV